jgi:hypothetical protein
MEVRADSEEEAIALVRDTAIRGDTPSYGYETPGFETNVCNHTYWGEVLREEAELRHDYD